MSTTAESTPAVAELHDAHASRRLDVYVRELYDRRSYIWHVAVNELRHRQITNVLGNLWHLLNPALTIGVYYMIFGLLLGVDRGVDKFFVFLTVGLFIFTFTQKATIDGAKSIVTNRGIIKAVRFPRALLPISSTTTELLATIPNFTVMVVIAVVSGIAPAPSWAFLLPLIAVQLVFTLGTAMIAARMTTHFADTTQILPFVFRLILYGSGVIFSVDAYVDEGSLTDVLFTLNPMYCFITLGRWSVMGGEFRFDLLLSAVVWSIVMFVVGFLWFRAGEERYARD